MRVKWNFYFVNGFLDIRRCILFSTSHNQKYAVVSREILFISFIQFFMFLFLHMKLSRKKSCKLVKNISYGKFVKNISSRNSKQRRLYYCFFSDLSKRDFYEFIQTKISLHWKKFFSPLAILSLLRNITSIGLF